MRSNKTNRWDLVKEPQTWLEYTLLDDSDSARLLRNIKITARFCSQDDFCIDIRRDLDQLGGRCNVSRFTAILQFAQFGLNICKSAVCTALQWRVFKFSVLPKLSTEQPSIVIGLAILFQIAPRPLGVKNHGKWASFDIASILLT